MKYYFFKDTRKITYLSHWYPTYKILPYLASLDNVPCTYCSVVSILAGKVSYLGGDFTFRGHFFTSKGHGLTFTGGLLFRGKNFIFRVEFYLLGGFYFRAVVLYSGVSFYGGRLMNQLNLRDHPFV